MFYAMGLISFLATVEPVKDGIPRDQELFPLTQTFKKPQTYVM